MSRRGPKTFEVGLCRIKHLRGPGSGDPKYRGFKFQKIFAGNRDPIFNGRRWRKAETRASYYVAKSLTGQGIGHSGAVDSKRVSYAILSLVR
jgi:hypothetical protein